jgi:hypothetical protein
VKLALLLMAAVCCQAQTFSQRGFLEVRSTFYPQKAQNDSGRVVGEALLRWDVSWQVRPDFKLFGSFDARADTHQQVGREARFDWQDRSMRRSAFSLRRGSAQWHRGGLTVEGGKQFIRWGKADILNPTDRFAPRDYLNVIDNDFLGVIAARATYENQGNTVDLVYAPRFTPSRTPLLNQRWVALPASPIPIIDRGGAIPGRGQFGVRTNHIGRGFEVSGVFYDGFQHLPEFFTPQYFTVPKVIDLFRRYPKLRLYGADTAVPLKWFTLKGEAASFNNDYVIYVAQVERMVGEWTFVGGYAGEAVVESRDQLSFAPDRGFAKSILGRAAYTIGPRRSLAVEAAVRQNGDGSWVRGEYSHQFGAHWRATGSFTLIRGEMQDFLGQYRKNVHGMLAIRYSF